MQEKYVFLFVMTILTLSRISTQLGFRDVKLQYKKKTNKSSPLWTGMENTFSIYIGLDKQNF